jgi:branched-chain amino acid transport system permease protein
VGGKKLYGNYLIQMFVNGILLAGIYAVVTTGLNIIYGVIRIVNFCHGEMLSLAMYLSYWFFALYGISPYLSIPFVCIALFIVGALIQALVIEGAPHETQGVLTLGLYLAMQGLMLFMWTSDYRVIDLPSFSINFLGAYIGIYRLVALVGVIIVTIIFYVALIKTRFGIVMRAVVQDPIMAEWLGINTKMVRIISFGLGALLAGLAGALLIPIYYVYPGSGLSFALMGWVVMVLGGLGNFIGALFGSLIIGITESVVASLYNAQLAPAISLIIFFIIILIRPQGLVGSKR